MNIHEQLQRWGEPPLTPAEEALVALLDALARGERPADTVEEPPVAGLLRRLERSTESFGSEAGLLASPDAETVILPDPFPGEFRFLRVLGGGAYGRVYLAEEIKLGGRLAALKTLQVADDPARLAALVREASIIGRLKHRNLVQVYTWRDNGPEAWLVMEYVAGGSLEDRLEQRGPLPWQEAARYVADVAEGLAHAHAAGVVHRDIKPANILFDEKRREALLTDFGVVASRSSSAPSVAGTRQYMAPEGFEPGGLSPKLDVYSLAATLFRLLTGTPPYPGPAPENFVFQALDGLAADDQRLSGVPGPLEEVIRAGLTADPSARPELDAFRAALRGALNRLTADDLAARPAAWLHLAVERREGGRFVPAATTRLAARTRNMVRKQPPAPAEGVRLRTGDVVRVQVESERPGYVTVFNVGPTGDLNLLYPEALGGPASASAIAAGSPVEAPEVEMQAPAGTERLFALWTVRPMPLREADLWAAASGKGPAPSSEYTATRNMARVKQAVQGLRPEEWATAVLEVEHEE